MMYKSMIAPFVGVLAIVAQLIFGVEISEEIQSQAIEVFGNGVALALIIYGIIKNHKK